MLGHKDEDDERVPRVVESLLGRDIVMAACGVAHTMALGGSAVCPAASHTLSLCVTQSLERCTHGAQGSMGVWATGTCETDFLH